ncbi:MAG: outer membrane beta-barrel protein [Pseudomonadota bacterium]
MQLTQHQEAPLSNEQSSNWYAALGLGWNFADNLSLGGSDRLEFDFGLPMAVLTAGRRLPGNWKLELDASYRSNDVEVIFLGDNVGTQPSPADYLLALSGQLSLIREFRREKALRPYLGAGLGLTQLSLTLRDYEFSGSELLLDDEDFTWAWQFLAGFSVPMGDKWDLALDYRFWQAPSASFTALDGEQFDVSHSVHSGTLHLRYLFGGRQEPSLAPPPALGSGWYAAANLGLAYAVDTEIDGSLENFDAFKVGPSASLAFGYDTARRWRLELELSRRENDVEIIDFNPFIGQFAATGEVVADSVMANALYRFRLNKAVRPIIGFDLGASFTDYDVTVLDGPAAGLYLDDKASGPAFQAILGLDYALTKRTTLTIDYRSWITWDLKMRRPDGSPLETWHWTNSMSLGVRYSLR